MVSISILAPSNQISSFLYAHSSTTEHVGLGIRHDSVSQLLTTQNIRRTCRFLSLVLFNTERSLFKYLSIGVIPSQSSSSTWIESCDSKNFTIGKLPVELATWSGRFLLAWENQIQQYNLSRHTIKRIRTLCFGCLPVMVFNFLFFFPHISIADLPVILKRYELFP